MGRFTDFLFPRPTALEGIGSLLDFSPLRERYNDSKTPDLADRIASRMDWEAVAADFRSVMSDPEIEQRLRQTER